jgi:lipid-A-disaccharide synthase
LCELAVIGFIRVFMMLPQFIRLLLLANRFFKEHRPDAVVLIDYPGFHWWLARRARAHNIKVFYFVPPQIWAWAGWRVNKMRRFVDHVLCTLEFEEKWYQSRGVDARFVGHPYFDELAEQQLHARFVEEHQEKPGTRIALLPGSRNQEIENNWPTILAAAKHIYQKRPDVRFLVACFKEKHQVQIKRTLEDCDLPIEVFTGRTPEIIYLAHSCIAVSGSVSLELLYRKKPSVVIFLAGWFVLKVAYILKTCRFISLVNLLAHKELFPEFLGHRVNPTKLAEPVLDWLSNQEKHQTCIRELDILKSQVAKPGACKEAACEIWLELHRLEKASRAA